MLNCAEQVQIQNTKHMHIRHSKQQVSKKIMLKHPTKQLKNIKPKECINVHINNSSHTN